MSTKYQLWVTYNQGKTKFRFPVLPEKINVDNGYSTDSLDIPGFGELVMKRGRKALSFSFDCFFPANYYQGCSYKNFPAPLACVKTLEKIKNGAKNCKLIFTALNINIECIITDFPYSMEGGDVGTIPFSISFVESRTVAPKKLKVSKTTKKASTATKTTRSNNKVIPKTYKTKKNDNLQKIAKRYYGKQSYWEKIYKANKKKISNPKKIKVGTVLSLP